ncbi:MAG TPA: LuxR C-terminal-related transcriptional regulator [Opitutaceae bacterium]|nr:LuxR C-terminal-related transcriptional regulator [Opitutaceae bacterium]
MRDYLGRLLERELGASAVVSIGSMAELRERERELRGARLVLFDLDLGDGSTVEWAIGWAAKETNTRLVALSSVQGAVPFKQLQVAGISLVHKNDTQAELVAALRVVLGGGVVVSRQVQELLAQSRRDPLSPVKVLGPKELRVLALLGQRLRNEEIAEILGCSIATVADHRKHIMAKLDCHHIEEVIDFAIRHGVVHSVNVAEPPGERGVKTSR